MTVVEGCIMIAFKRIAAADNINLDAYGVSNPMEYFRFKANPIQQ